MRQPRRPATAQLARADGCPIIEQGRRSCPIKGSNNMPATPQQTKAPGQTTNLDTTRASSTIQKGGTQTGNILANVLERLVRKDKADGADETDMAPWYTTR